MDSKLLSFKAAKIEKGVRVENFKADFACPMAIVYDYTIFKV